MAGSCIWAKEKRFAACVRGSRSAQWHGTGEPSPRTDSVARPGGRRSTSAAPCPRSAPRRKRKPGRARGDAPRGSGRHRARSRASSAPGARCRGQWRNSCSSCSSRLRSEASAALASASRAPRSRAPPRHAVRHAHVRPRREGRPRGRPVEERAKVATGAGLNVGDHDPLAGDLHASPPIGGFRSRLDQHHVKCLEEREVEIAVDGDAQRAASDLGRAPVDAVVHGCSESLAVGERSSARQP